MSGERCDLCGLPLPRDPIIVDLESDPKHFCCEGCARVYQVARDTDMLDIVLQQMGAAKERPQNQLKTASTPKATAYFDINGMWCAGCALAAERVLLSRPGVVDASISFAVEKGRIEYHESLVDPSELLKGLEPLGYHVKITSSKEKEEKERFQNRVGLQLMAATAFGMEIMVLYLVQLYPAYSLGLYATTTIRRIQYVVWALTTPVVFYAGSTFLMGAWRSLRAKTVGMDTLVALGVLSSYFYSVYVTLSGNGQTYFDSSSMIVNFILIGRYLEQVGGAQARKDLHSLLRLQPALAWRKSDTGWTQVQSDTLIQGDTIMVKPGERVPADGEIMDGEVTLDESMLTGESLPVSRKVGELVYAGTISREGAIIGTVLQPAGKTRLSQIADMVTQTLSQKPRIQRLADTVSTYFAFAILILAVITFMGWFLRTHSSGSALMACVAVLVVACPCALGLATPLSLAVTMGSAAQKGILIRTPEALETSSSIRKFVFDKTGTLTQGSFSVVEVYAIPESSYPMDDILQLAASVEQFSEHPLAAAILRANQEGLLPATEFVSLRGAGASARVGSTPAQRISVGSSRLIPIDASSEWLKRSTQSAARGETVVWVAVDGRPVGFIALKDRPNPTAHAALKWLKDQGIQTVMLSGDTPLAAKSVAAELGIELFEGSCTPEVKAEKIKAWQENGQKVGMAGDGVNDAPALAQADLSITTVGGSDISGKASDLVLTRSDLTLIPWFIMASQRTRKTILQNLGWAFAYNLVAVPLAMTGLITPVIAAIAMAISSLVVVINSLRLRKS
jgi:heavy metal translocating P-type ATPase